MAERFSCARAARTRQEKPHATASTVRRWILVEQPGPWGHDAVTESRLPASVASRLTRRATDLRARLLLVRRPGGVERPTRACFLARTDARDWWVERFDVEDAEALLDLDMAPLAEGRRPGGTPVEEPLHLVCTNGRHDACCAEFGRPLVTALAGRPGGQVWECSHIGGDRFAGNLVCFPHGVYFGHVDASHGPEVAGRYERGELDLPHYRGRSAYSFVTQAGEWFVRDATGLTGVDDLVFQRRDTVDGELSRIVFTDRTGRRHEADVRSGRETASHPLTCHAETPARPRRFELQRLRSWD